MRKTDLNLQKQSIKYMHKEHIILSSFIIYLLEFGDSSASKN